MLSEISAHLGLAVAHGATSRVYMLDNNNTRTPFKMKRGCLINVKMAGAIVLLSFPSVDVVRRPGRRLVGGTQADEGCYVTSTMLI